MEKPEVSDVERLRDVLALERECCSSLAGVLRSERVAAHGHDLEGLIAALREREAIQARWEAAARRRGEILAGATAMPEGADAELAELRRGLVAEAATLRREQALNEAVLRGALDGVNELLATLRRHLPGARYDGRANVTADPPGGLHAAWRA